MASDLSTIIQEGLCNTLNGLLSKQATIKTVSKLHEKDISELQTLKVNSTFEFNDIVSTWSFIIPAYTASYIFNQMIGDDSEPVLEIDNDIADAINEVVSNISGGLTTTINGSGLADLGEVKFTTTSEGIVDGKDLVEEENIFKFLIDLEGVDITFFIQFDNVILPFIDNINSSEVSVYEEEPQEVEEEVVENSAEESDIKEDEPQDEIKEDNLEIENITTNDENKTSTESENEDNENKEEETEDNKKNKKLKIIIIVIAALIVLIIGAGATMYFMGMFDPKPIKVVDTNSTNTTKKSKDGIDIIEYKPKKNIHFNVSKINVRRLNARLEILTKYDILTPAEIEKQKLAEKERLLQLQKEKELEEFARRNKEEPLHKAKTEDNTPKVVTKKADTTTKTIIKKTNSNMNFIMVNSLKYKLFKNAISKINTKDGRISICQDKDGRTAVYLGPFYNDTDIKQIATLIEEKEAKLVVTPIKLSQQEFDNRCNFQ